MTASSCSPSRTHARTSAAPPRRKQSYALYAATAEQAHALGLGINAGHDLDLENLVRFRALPYLDEVSIGHALISRALFVGLGRVVREYLDVLAGHRRAVNRAQPPSSAMMPSTRFCSRRRPGTSSR